MRISNFKKLLLSTSIIGTMVLLVGCGSKSSNQNSKKLSGNQKINLSTTAEITSLDLSKIYDKTSFIQVDETFEGLYRYDENGNVDPALATKTRISKDGKTYTIDIRHNAKWSNGDPVTANDFVYSWQRAVNPKTASQYTYLFDNVKNASAIVNGKLLPSKLGIKAIGKYQLKVQLARPTTYFKMVMARETLYPLDKKVVEKYGKNYGTSAKTTVYNGPFKNVGWTGTNDSWKLVKNNQYWDKKAVKLSQINYTVAKSPSTAYNLFQSGKLDLISLVGEQAKQLGKSKDAVKRPLAATEYLQYNQRKGVFKNRNLRLAFSLALNRSQLINKVMQNGSIVSKGFVPADFAKNPKTGEDFAKEAYVPGTVDHDSAKAKQYYKKALSHLGKKNLTIKLLSADDDQTKNVIEFIQSELQETLPGLKIESNSMPFPSMLARSSAGNFDVNFTGWSADFADPISFLSQFTSHNPENNGKWENKQFDQAIKDSNNKDANNSTKRWEDLINAEKILATDQGITPIYQANGIDLVNPKLKGVVYDRINGHYDYRTAYLTK
ncbi:peptide ABC transporter substrate-binding protein [Lentilactobacillus kefiri]|uniref:ABC transporter periplasmic protein n=2 Tax=Lentilactobacillus kefiri TaxID=33962 RepID=A0A8E1V1G0_LENKE|nr:peptide ABC transporter substrate-binding protein [Lentilactobacillus kefiri]KRL75490.1 ABC transporter periplasmic protein [Lentilactobacillus parakefiri DSM 10551]KRM53620.1 ABC transporter periplasmic protein [Lentilactobacillus kefiri DSM 20587 = JCM 5818]MCJ2161091.1 peptide ABC transporter substrate-binding protein [Lentilactobacillus kefiri]MCP9369372.1 peptide ABC transporter substrate-binding protein [Lentilactobacillus kefiri]MDH5109356.1 peptide ABC transporter substrate-binding 